MGYWYGIVEWHNPRTGKMARSPVGPFTLESDCHDSMRQKAGIKNYGPYELETRDPGRANQELREILSTKEGIPMGSDEEKQEYGAMERFRHRFNKD